MNELAIMESTDQRMSSLEIAELTGKRHKNVVRDIKALIDQGAITELSFELSEYTDSSGKMNVMHLLDFEATMTLITGYDAKRRSVVIDRWMALETGIAQPACLVPKDIPSMVYIDKEFRAALRMAKALGLQGNQAVHSANVVTRNITGIDCLQLLGVTHLIIDDQERCFTPTEIGLLTGIGSPQEVNRRLEALGFQVKEGETWVPTATGKRFVCSHGHRKEKP